MDTIRLNNSKRVLVSEPYHPREDTRSEFVGRLHEMKMITAAWIGGRATPPLCRLLVGEPGVGKNRLVYEYELARRSGVSLW